MRVCQDGSLKLSDCGSIDTLSQCLFNYYELGLTNYQRYFQLKYYISSMLSSLNLTSETPITAKVELPRVNIILKALLQHNQAYDFKQPVDWKGMNLSDYPNIIKHPMDLSTVQKNLRQSKYKMVEEFLDHIQLIWDNCKAYNMAGSWIYQVAEKIERVFKKMIRNYFPDIPIVIPQKPAVPIKTDKRLNTNTFEHLNLYAEEDLTYFEKLKFCERVQKLDEQQLQKLINWIKQKCPEAIKDTNQDRLQILVDGFSQQNFAQANELLFNLAEGQIDRVIKKVKIV